MKKRQVNKLLKNKCGFLLTQDIPRKLGELAEFHDIDLVIDVGANIGQFGLALRKYYFRDLISFEPFPKSYSELLKAIGSDKRWTAHRIALGNTKDPEKSFNSFERSDLNSFASPNEFSGALFGSVPEEGEPMTVCMDTLENFIHENKLENKKILLKMDTQGFDLEVFRGVGTCISQVRVLLSEVSVKPIYYGIPHWLDSLREYESAGFSVAHLLPVNAYEHKIVEYDCIMVKTF